ncbi:MAG: 2-hydroxyacyl-CoA dehydratase family protein [Clostridiales Family XIII bacterium]|jgi:benzoyl-CoA reductase/2-hydroxyglutaryl-CoA dehydratase subunit BcrC/BadD/HgdB|nr:2-hydroxyacyl-CoA dehydratase family protein [Clostridiales Family XIII bacterium]
MSDLREDIRTLTESGLHPARTIRASLADTGKDAVGCFPIYTPEEIVYAGGFLPVGMWGGRTEITLADAYLQGFCCPIMKANLEYGLNGTYRFLKAVLIPTLCDTLKCVCENWKSAVPSIPMIGVAYPQARWTKAGKDYLISEYKRVRSDLEKATGRLIADAMVEEAFRLYEGYRASMREFTEAAKRHPVTIDAKTRHLLIKAGYFMDKARYTPIIRRITEGLNLAPAERFQGIRAIAVGLIGEPFEVLDILSENGIAIVNDDLAQESRQFRTPARAEGDVWERMAGLILDRKGCAFLCERKKTKGPMLIDMARRDEARAVIVMMMKFCDPEEFDYPIYKAQLEREGIPHLLLEVEQRPDSFEQLRTRIQSFAEML